MRGTVQGPGPLGTPSTRSMARSSRDVPRLSRQPTSWPRSGVESGAGGVSTPSASSGLLGILGSARSPRAQIGLCRSDRRSTPTYGRLEGDAERVPRRRPVDGPPARKPAAIVCPRRSSSGRSQTAAAASGSAPAARRGRAPIPRSRVRSAQSRRRGTRTRYPQSRSPSGHAGSTFRPTEACCWPGGAG